LKTKGIYFNSGLKIREERILKLLLCKKGERRKK